MLKRIIYPLTMFAFYNNLVAFSFFYFTFRFWSASTALSVPFVIIFVCKCTAAIKNSKCNGMVWVRKFTNNENVKNDSLFLFQINSKLGSLPNYLLLCQLGLWKYHTSCMLYPMVCNCCIFHKIFYYIVQQLQTIR